jgi:hypothetical protein
VQSRYEPGQVRTENKPITVLIQFLDSTQERDEGFSEFVVL